MSDNMTSRFSCWLKASLAFVVVSLGSIVMLFVAVLTAFQLRRLYAETLAGAIGRMVLRKDGRRYAVSFRGQLVCNNGRAMREAALTGLGLAVLPDFYTKTDLDSGGLVHVLTDYEFRESALHAVFPPGRKQTSATRLFVERLASELKSDLCTKLDRDFDAKRSGR